MNKIISYAKRIIEILITKAEIEKEGFLTFKDKAIPRLILNKHVSI